MTAHEALRNLTLAMRNAYSSDFGAVVIASDESAEVWEALEAARLVVDEQVTA